MEKPSQKWRSACEIGREEREGGWDHVRCRVFINWVQIHLNNRIWAYYETLFLEIYLYDQTTNFIIERVFSTTTSEDSLLVMQVQESRDPHQQRNRPMSSNHPWIRIFINNDPFFPRGLIHYTFNGTQYLIGWQLHMHETRQKRRLRRALEWSAQPQFPLHSKRG